MLTVVLGSMTQNFHWHVPPTPISVSATQPDFTPRLTQAPIAPQTFSSRDDFTSTVALKAIFKSFFSVRLKTRWKVCLNKVELKLSPITMWPLNQRITRYWQEDWKCSMRNGIVSIITQSYCNKISFPTIQFDPKHKSRYRFHDHSRQLEKRGVHNVSPLSSYISRYPSQCRDAI